MAVQHLGQRAAFEGEQGRDGGVAHGGEGRVDRIALGRRHHGHQRRAEAVAPVSVAQTGEAQRRRRQQFLRQGHVAGEAGAVEPRRQLPAADSKFDRVAGRRTGPGCAGVARVAVEQPRHGPLHREVVVVAHLGLAVLEGAVTRAAAGEEEVGPGMAGRLQPGVHRRGVGVAALPGRLRVRRFRRDSRRPVGLQRGLQPQLGQGRQPLLVGDALGLRQRLPAAVGGLAAVVDAGHARDLLRGPAQVPGGQHVAAPFGQVERRGDGGHRHRRAARHQQRCGEQQPSAQAAAGPTLGGDLRIARRCERHRPDRPCRKASAHRPASMPGTPRRMACENWGSASAAFARSVMRPAARRLSRSALAARPSMDCRYSGR